MNSIVAEYQPVAFLDPVKGIDEGFGQILPCKSGAYTRVAWVEDDGGYFICEARRLDPDTEGVGN